ncbi:LOW QUALITY PROTEIN: probable polyamine oxidase 4 [Manihot esculenta]|uniref:LOW QUALITY PROTEIN: probable polyamine oxidase 4 n=1 Tax=Manihot esculenta TaxID=3983 RepID=UPI000B5D7A45|nr:LOW QUALITY PROTEIN: probable polyamine oxidase 4 [Manihot esculenta]
MLKKFIGCSRKDLVGKSGFDRGCFNSSLYNRTIVSGLAAARILYDASFNNHEIDLVVVFILDYSFGYPVDLGASWQEGLANEVLQWYICRMETWFAVDADMISLKRGIRQEHVLSGGRGLMVQGYIPVIKDLAKDINICLSYRVTKICYGPNKVMVMVEDGRNFIADAAIVTVPIGILKANLIQFEPNLPDWKVAAISDIGVGSENKVAIKFDEVFWPNVEFLGIVTPTSYACGYFLNLHKATGYPVLVYMAAGRFAYDLEKLSDESAANFVILLLRKMFPDATEPVLYLVSRWGTDPNSLGYSAYNLFWMTKSGDVYERLCAPLGSLFFTGEAVSMDHQGSVYGAYSAGVMAAENCQRHALENLGHLEKLQLVPLRCELHEAAFPLQISKM